MDLSAGQRPDSLTFICDGVIGSLNSVNVLMCILCLYTVCITYLQLECVSTFVCVQVCVFNSD